MKPIFTLSLLFFFFSAFAQKIDSTAGCRDKVFLRDGSRFVGQLVEYVPGKIVVLKTWSGLMLHIPPGNVRRVVQECDEKKEDILANKAWYHASRVGNSFATKSDYDQQTGYFLQHSSGYRFNQFFGLGLGVGVENLSPGQYSSTGTYPLFMDARGYFLSKKFSPMYAAGLGWGFPMKGYQQQCFECYAQPSWRGGVFAQFEVGYRLGSHIFATFGVRHQSLKMRYSPGYYYAEKLRKKYFIIGIGIVM